MRFSSILDRFVKDLIFKKWLQASVICCLWCLRDLSCGGKFLPSIVPLKNEIRVSKNEIRVPEISVILFLFISFISPQISQQILLCISAVYIGISQAWLESFNKLLPLIVIEVTKCNNMENQLQIIEYIHYKRLFHNKQNIITRGYCIMNFWDPLSASTSCYR